MEVNMDSVVVLVPLALVLLLVVLMLHGVFKVVENVLGVLDRLCADIAELRSGIADVKGLVELSAKQCMDNIQVKCPGVEHDQAFDCAGSVGTRKRDAKGRFVKC